MNKEDLKVDDWVIVTTRSLVPLEKDATPYDGIPCVVKEIFEDHVRVYSPLKVCFGRPPIDDIPFCQLIKIDAKSGDQFVRDVRETDTYTITRTRCDF